MWPQLFGVCFKLRLRDYCITTSKDNYLNCIPLLFDYSIWILFPELTSLDYSLLNNKLFGLYRSWIATARVLLLGISSYHWVLEDRCKCKILISHAICSITKCKSVDMLKARSHLSWIQSAVCLKSVVTAQTIHGKGGNSVEQDQMLIRPDEVPNYSAH